MYFSSIFLIYPFINYNRYYILMKRVLVFKKKEIFLNKFLLVLMILFNEQLNKLEEISTRREGKREIKALKY